MPQEQSYNYQLKANDFLEATQLKQDVLQPKWFSLIIRPIIILYFWSFPISSLIRIKYHDFMVATWIPFAIEIAAAKTTTDYLWEALSMLPIIFLAVDSIYPKLGIINRWKTYRSYQQNYIKQEPKQLVISDHKIKIISENLTEIVAWSDLGQVAENKKIFLLVDRRKQEYKIIPKRAFTQRSDLETFQSILREKISNQL